MPFLCLFYYYFIVCVRLRRETERATVLFAQNSRLKMWDCGCLIRIPLFSEVKIKIKCKYTEVEDKECLRSLFNDKIKSYFVTHERNLDHISILVFT